MLNVTYSSQREIRHNRCQLLLHEINYDNFLRTRIACVKSSVPQQMQRPRHLVTHHRVHFDHSQNLTEIHRQNMILCNKIMHAWNTSQIDCHNQCYTRYRVSHYRLNQKTFKNAVDKENRRLICSLHRRRKTYISSHERNAAYKSYLDHLKTQKRISKYPKTKIKSSFYKQIIEKNLPSSIYYYYPDMYRKIDNRKLGCFSRKRSTHERYSTLHNCRFPQFSLRMVTVEDNFNEKNLDREWQELVAKGDAFLSPDQKKKLARPVCIDRLNYLDSGDASESCRKPYCISDCMKYYDIKCSPISQSHNIVEHLRRCRDAPPNKKTIVQKMLEKSTQKAISVYAQPFPDVLIVNMPRKCHYEGKLSKSLRINRLENGQDIHRQYGLSKTKTCCTIRGLSLHKRQAELIYIYNTYRRRSTGTKRSFNAKQYVKHRTLPVSDTSVDFRNEVVEQKQRNKKTDEDQKLFQYF